MEDSMLWLATLLAHPREKAKIIVYTDASDFAIGGAIHQVADGVTGPLAFYLRKLTAAERNYSTYDRELLAMFATVKHFQTQLEGREFCIQTDHKPLQYAFVSISDKASFWVRRQLEFLSQFTTDVRYLPGPENVTADVFSRLEAIARPEMQYVDYEALAKDQLTDSELRHHLNQPRVRDCA